VSAAALFVAGLTLTKFTARVTVTVHKTIVRNDPDDEPSSTRNMIASMY
jgi:hypothetical protein